MREELEDMIIKCEGQHGGAMYDKTYKELTEWWASLVQKAREEFVHGVAKEQAPKRGLK